MSDDLKPSVLKHTVLPRVGMATGIIELEETIEGAGDVIRDQFFKTVVQTRDEAIRQGLVALGWTPPGGDPRPLLTLYVVESTQGDWLWSGRFPGQAATMQMAIARHSQGCKLVTYRVLPSTRTEVKAAF